MHRFQVTGADAAALELSGISFDGIGGKAIRCQADQIIVLAAGHDDALSDILPEGHIHIPVRCLIPVDEDLIIELTIS